jgi:hypothetical protein
MPSSSQLVERSISTGASERCCAACSLQPDSRPSGAMVDAAEMAAQPSRRRRQEQWYVMA